MSTPIDEYLKSVPDKERQVLEHIQSLIKKIVPDTEEVISYQVPTFKYKGLLVHFAYYKNHLSFFPGSKKVTIDFLPKLKGFKTAAATIQFSADNPIPDNIIEEIVKVRVRENEDRWKKKEK